jgi:glycine dehydrogenase subunit 1
LIETKKEMMQSIGIQDIDELFADIPQKYALKRNLDLPAAMSELELKRHVEKRLKDSKTYNDMSNFLGAGCWPHYVPTVVKEIVQRSELLTSYTPYQPEISQGMLQILFEYQSMICELTGMDVANCSMYDWASSLGEAARMSSRKTGKHEIIVPKIIHPERLATLKSYVQPAGIEVKQVAYDSESGQIDFDDLKTKISNNTAAVYVENPSYLGFIEEQVEEISKKAHKNNALFIVGVDPTSLGVLKPPGEYEADIVIGEAQPLGNAMNFGGPLLGIMATRNDISMIRQMPGRIIGLTTSQTDGKLGFCMTLQTREQHIRREKATSNICSNEALCAVASAVYMSLLGPQGMRDLGEAITLKSNYTLKLLSKIHGLKSPIFGKSSHFKEFTVNFDQVGQEVEEVNQHLLECNIQGGKDISKEFPELGQSALFCVTEMHTAEQIEELAQALGSIAGGKGK